MEPIENIKSLYAALSDDEKVDHPMFNYILDNLTSYGMYVDKEGNCVSYFIASVKSVNITKDKTLNLALIDFATLPEYRQRALNIMLMEKFLTKFNPDAVLWVTSLKSKIGIVLMKRFGFVLVDDNMSENEKHIFDIFKGTFGVELSEEQKAYQWVK